MKNSENNKDLINELKRKLIHLSSVSVPILYFFADRKIMLFTLSAGFFSMAMIDILRFRNGYIKKFYNKYLGSILRGHEADDKNLYFTGGTYIVLAFLLCVLLFEKNIAILSMLIIIFCDTAAAITGKLCGKHFIKNKTIEGSLAFFFVGMIFYFLIMNPDSFNGLIIGVIAVFLTTLFELLPLKMDDNITIPLFFGITYSLLSKTNLLI